MNPERYALTDGLWKGKLVFQHISNIGQMCKACKPIKPETFCRNDFLLKEGSEATSQYV